MDISKSFLVFLNPEDVFLAKMALGWLWAFDQIKNNKGSQIDALGPRYYALIHYEYLQVSCLILLCLVFFPGATLYGVTGLTNSR